VVSVPGRSIASRLTCSGASILVVLACVSSALAVSSEVQEAFARVEELHTQLARARAEALAIEKDAQVAAGDDVLALQSTAMEIRLASTADLQAMVDILTELERDGADITAHRARLEGLLPNSIARTQRGYKSATASLTQLSESAEGTGSADSPEIARRRAQLDTWIERNLAAGIDQVLMLEALSLSPEAARNWFVARVQHRARLVAARTRWWAARRAEMDETSEAEADVAALAIADTRLKASTDSLAEVVGMLDVLELDAARYQRLLIESTGEISADLFDRRVAGRLISRWTRTGTQSFIENAPGAVLKVVIFALLIAAFWLLSRFVRRGTERALEHGSLRLSLLLKRTIVSVASSAVLMVGVLIGLSQLGVEVGPLLAGLGIAGFVLGFALQDTLGNFASGMLILAYQPYDVGDLIECAGGVFGRVSQMNLVSTTILTLDNQTLVVPNGKIWGDVITNVTAQKVRRVDLVFGISYTDDIPKAERVLSAILEAHPKVLDKPEFVVKLHELGDSSVNFVVRPWVLRDDYWDVHWDITRAVKLEFDREGISIPFPQRDVHFYPTSANSE
jgi:small conductance mechanosensitive channel